MGDYKEHKIFSTLRRKGIITTYIILIAIIFITAIVLVRKTVGQKQIQDIVYTEKSNIGYKVYLKENEFFEGEYLGENNQYIASLINYVQANFKYELSSPEKNVDYKYSYKVMANIDVLDKSSNNPLYKFQDTLVEETEHIGNTNSKLVLNQPITIDYNKYNDIIKKFVEMYDLSDYNSYLTVNMFVSLLDDEGKGEASVPVMTLRIPLTEETMAIDIESKTVNETTNNSEDTSLNSRGYLFAGIVLIFVDLLIIRKLVRFIRDTESEEAVYNAKLRKILVSYGSYIQKVDNEYDFDKYQVLEIEVLEDLLQIRETINKPILMMEKDKAEDTYFFIPTENIAYIYELKKGNFKKNREKEYKVNKNQENNNEIKM